MCCLIYIIIYTKRYTNIYKEVVINYINKHKNKHKKMETTNKQNKQEQEQNTIYKYTYCPVCKKMTKQVKHSSKNYYICSHRIGVSK